MLNKNKFTDNVIDCFVRACEKSALSAFPFIGKNDKNAADGATVSAFEKSMSNFPFQLRVAVGEGEKDEAPLLQLGAYFGSGDYMIDIAVDPLECTTQCAKGQNGAFSTLAIAHSGSILSLSSAYYMNKIVTCVACDVSCDYSVQKNIDNITQAYGCKTSELYVTVMNRKRNQKIIDGLHDCGVEVRLVDGGSIEEAIRCAKNPDQYGVYMGICGAPEGIISASALKSLGAQIVGKFLFCTYDVHTGEPIEIMHRKEEARQNGLDPDKEYSTYDLVQGDTVFFASGITDSSLCDGVKESRNTYTVSTLILSTFGDGFREISNTYSR